MGAPRVNQKFDQIDEQPYLSSWSAQSELTGDEELEQYRSLEKLRTMMNKLLKNSSIARAQQLAKKTSIIGGKIFFNVDAPESIQQKAQKILQEEFKAIDINNEYSLQEMFEQIITGAFANGDILINLPMDEEREGLKTYIELIEASRIKTPHEMVNDPLVRNGVQYTEEGKITGYWVKKILTDPKVVNSHSISLLSDNKENFDFFETFKGGRRVAYLFKAPTALQPNMARQYPPLTPAMEDCRLVEKYIKAVVIGAQVAACHSLFITTSNAVKSKKSVEKSASDSEKRGMVNVGKTSPGTVYYLRRGDSVTSFNPSQPTANVDPFIKRMMINISSCVRNSYEIAHMHLEDVTLSSWKGGTLESARDAQLWVNDLMWVGEWIGNTLLLEAIVDGMLKGSLSNVKITFHFPKYNPLDDEKSARGSNINLNKNKTTSRHIVCGENNINYDKMLKDRQQEALDEVRLEAEVLKLKKQLEKKEGIIFGVESPELGELESQETQDRDTSGSRRPGEETGSDLDPEDARDREREDGNI